MGTNRRPDPEPLEADDVAVVTAGAVLWAAALVVLAVLAVLGSLGDRESWLRVAAAGAFLGAIGVRHVRRRRSSRAAGARADGG